MEIEIIMQIVRAIMECTAQRREDDVAAGLLNPGRREYRAIVRLLREKGGLCGRELRSEAAETFALLQDAAPEDIYLLMEDVNALAEKEN